MVYTAVQDMSCGATIGQPINDLDAAKASCTSNQDCGGIEVGQGMGETFYVLCYQLISNPGANAFRKGNSYFWRANRAGGTAPWVMIL